MTRSPCDLYTATMAAAAMTGGPFPGFVVELSLACRPDDHTDLTELGL